MVSPAQLDSRPIDRGSFERLLALHNLRSAVGRLGIDELMQSSLKEQPLCPDLEPFVTLAGEVIEVIQPGGDDPAKAPMEVEVLDDSDKTWSAVNQLSSLYFELTPSREIFDASFRGKYIEIDDNEQSLFVYDQDRAVRVRLTATAQAAVVKTGELPATKV